MWLEAVEMGQEEEGSPLPQRGWGLGGMVTALQRTGALALKGVAFFRADSDALWDMAF